MCHLNKKDINSTRQAMYVYCVTFVYCLYLFDFLTVWHHFKRKERF